MDTLDTKQITGSAGTMYHGTSSQVQRLRHSGTACCCVQTPFYQLSATMMMILLQLLWMPKHPWVVYRYIIKHLHRHTTQDKQYRVSPPGSRSPVLQVEVLETDLNFDVFSESRRETLKWRRWVQVWSKPSRTHAQCAPLPIEPAATCRHVQKGCRVVLGKRRHASMHSSLPSTPFSFSFLFFCPLLHF